MRYALIDNSTLTGIQRLLGEIPVKNSAVIDNDLLGFENYIQAILFYDNIICIDDYKEQYRNKRIKAFPEIRFISKDYFDYNTIVQTASKITENITLEVKGGKVSDSDFKEYFERLDMNFQFTWDMSTSNYFLTQKMLQGNSFINQDHFSKLHSVLFSEKNEQFDSELSIVDKKPRLFDSKGNQIYGSTFIGEINNIPEGDGLSAQFKAFVSGLNWLSLRTTFYVLAADYLYADLFIQPLRQSFLQNIIRRIYPNYDLGVFSGVINSINNMSKESLNRIIENTDNFGISYDIPLFSAYFAKKRIILQQL